MALLRKSRLPEKANPTASTTEGTYVVVIAVHDWAVVHGLQSGLYVLMWYESRDMGGIHPGLPGRTGAIWPFALTISQQNLTSGSQQHVLFLFNTMTTLPSLTLEDCRA